MGWMDRLLRGKVNPMKPLTRKERMKRKSKNRMAAESRRKNRQ